MMALIGTLYAVVVWTWVQYLPGYVVGRFIAPDLRGGARHGISLVCGFSTVPFLLFLLSVAASIPMDGPLVVLAATAINVCGVWLLRPWRDPQVGRRDTGILALAALFCALYLAFAIRSLDGGDVFSTVHHCLYVIVMHTIGNDPSVGVPLYDGLSDQVVHYLVHHPTSEFNGLAPMFFEQRLGNAPILAPAVALFGTAGWYITGVFATTTAGVCIYLASREVGARPLVAAVSALVFVWGVRAFCMYFVNENNYAVTLVAFLLWGVLRRSTRLPWILLLGLTAGHLVGVRYTSSLFWPALAVAVLWHDDPWRARLTRFLAGAAVAMLALAPTLYINYLMLGDVFTHPKVHSEYASRIVKNSLGGWTFEFRALNWPFTEQVVRTAWNPFPSLLWLPLQVGRCFGHGAVALAALGWWRALRTRRTLVLLLLFAVPHSLAMGLVETLDWEQLTYSAPGLVPLGVVFALGLEWLVSAFAGGTAAWRRPLGVAVATFAVVTGLFFSARYTSWPVDTRVLSESQWPAPPATDAGTAVVADLLTTPSPLPLWPVLRSEFAGLTWRAMEAIVTAPALELQGGLPTYESGGVAILAGYAADRKMPYEFHMRGGEPRGPDARIRSSLGLHLVTLQLPTPTAHFRVERDLGHYTIVVQPPAEPLSALRDYSFYLHPWFPPVQSIEVNYRSPPSTGPTRPDTPLANLRVLAYGGHFDVGEERFIATNYPPERVDVVELKYTVDLRGEPPHCGLFVFLTGVDEQRVETLVLSGGHDQTWAGQTSGTLVVPTRLLADKVILYSEPYCSDHVPQPGDRYGVVEGPFTADRPLHFVLDRQW